MTRFQLLQRLCRRGSRRDIRHGGETVGVWNRVIRSESTACAGGAGSTSASSAGFRSGCSTTRINGCDDGVGLFGGSGPSGWDRWYRVGVASTIRSDSFFSVGCRDREWEETSAAELDNPRQQQIADRDRSDSNAASPDVLARQLLGLPVVPKSVLGFSPSDSDGEPDATSAFQSSPSPHFRFSALPSSASPVSPPAPFRFASSPSASPHPVPFRSAPFTSPLTSAHPSGGFRSASHGAGFHSSHGASRNLAFSAAGFHSSALYPNSEASGASRGPSDINDGSGSYNTSGSQISTSGESFLTDVLPPSGADVSGAVLGEGAAGVIGAATSDVGVTLASELAAAAAHCSAPIAMLQQLIGAVHDVAGLPWWLSIAAATVGIRLVLLPAFIYQVRSTVKMALIKPEMERLLNKVKAAGYDTDAVTHYNGKMQALLKKHNTTPFAPLLGIFLQAPVFIAFYFAITGMAEHMPSFATGGALWFTDLTTPDPLYLLPLISSAGILAAVELNAAEGMEGAPNAAQMKWFMRGLAVTMVPLTVTFPKAVFCYWITTNAFSLVQGLAFKRPGVRKALGIPIIKPPSSTSSPESASLGLPVTQKSALPPKAAVTTRGNTRRPPSKRRTR
ncbi:hypothetical protein CLOM_g15595 [Closterium sp. NIES-68]|nr:hypothetical protein CLOM_g15595 [Closterium sp. NIES-68]GJP79565.1 hypothetical protein CLOP_g9786 [Closterium sp. NIES-67]